MVAAVGREPSRKAAVRQAVREALGDLPIEPEIRFPVGRPQLLESLPGAEALFAFRLDEEVLQAGSSLRWVHLGISGVDENLPPSSSREGLVLTNSRGLHGPYMTEYVLGVVLARSKCLFQLRDDQREHRWEPRRHLPSIRTVVGTTMGLVGFGAVGRHLAPRAKALGMRVIGMKRTPVEGPLPEGVDALYGPEGLETVLAESDWLVVLLPLTPETRGIFSRAILGKMKRGAFLINVGRGELLDEKALSQAIAKGRLLGAALDVFREEPLPDSSEFWDDPRVLVTPHLAGNFPGYVEAAASLFGANLARFARNQPLEARVDPRLGY